MEQRSMFVGMDVHKESIDILLAEEGRDGEVRHYGGITGDLEALAKVVKALRAPTRRLRFVDEAGPCDEALRDLVRARRCRRPRGRSRRHPPLRPSAAPDGVSGLGAVGVFQRPERPPAATSSHGLLGASAPFGCWASVLVIRSLA